MGNWRDELHEDPIPWLLEPDGDQPAIRYFTLRDMLDNEERNSEVREAKKAIMTTGPVPAILAAQEPEGYWVQPGPGYSPKYRGTVWQLIFLSQLGADGTDPRVRAGGEYVLSHTIARHGGFGFAATPSSFAHCLAGNLGAALIGLGWLNDQRLQSAMAWQAATITGEAIANLANDGVLEPDDVSRLQHASDRNHRFVCRENGGLQCAWGAVKAMLAFSRVPPQARTETVRSAIEQGLAFLMSYDAAVADYPFCRGERPSTNWFKFGYPIGYHADVLQNLEALAALGKAQDTRLRNAVELVTSKQDAQGRWRMEHSYKSKMWVDIEKKGRTSKWVTLRALRVLKAAYPEAKTDRG